MLAGRNERSGGRMSYDERFSIRKEDRLHGVIGLTVYYGERPWDGPKSLHEMLADMPEEMKPMVADFPLNLLEIQDSDKLKFSNPDVEQVFSLSRSIYQKQIDHEKFSVVKSEVAEMVGAVVNSEQIMKIAQKGAGKEISMCNALEEMMSEREQLGQQRGEEIGKKIGKEIGEEIGKRLETVDLIVCKIRKGWSVKKTAEILEKDPAFVKQIYEIAETLAPEYDVKKIVDQLM